MRKIPTALCGLALLFAACSSVTTDQARIARTFHCSEQVALEAIEGAAASAGYRKINPFEYHRVLRTKHDPVIGLIEVSKAMDYGFGFTLSVESKTGACLVSFNPIQIVRMPFSKDEYNRSPLKPGTSFYAEVLSVIENARAKSEFD
jgi:hypothetical protein